MKINMNREEAEVIRTIKNTKLMSDYDILTKVDNKEARAMISRRRLQTLAEMKLNAMNENPYSDLPVYPEVQDLKKENCYDLRYCDNPTKEADEDFLNELREI